MLFNSLLASGLFGLVFGLPQNKCGTTGALIYEFPSSEGRVALENIAVRSNGHLLLDTSSLGRVYEIDPNTDRPEPKVIYEFPETNGTFGIAETSPDIFAVVTGNYTGDSQGVTGSFSVWTVDFNHASPVIRKIASIEGAYALNGMTVAPASQKDKVLIADSHLGIVWSLNLTSGSSEWAGASPYFQPSFPGSPDGSPFGINGVHANGNYVYFTSSAQRVYGRYPITATSEAEILAQAVDPNSYDDFAIGANGNAFIASPPNHIVEISSPSNKARNITDPALVSLVNPTSLALGLGNQSCTLYVVTAGNVGNGGEQNGQLFSVDIC